MTQTKIIQRPEIERRHRHSLIDLHTISKLAEKISGRRNNSRYTVILYSVKFIMKTRPIATVNVSTKLLRPLYSSHVAAGFPSPAEDHVDRSLDLNEHLIPHPSSTYFARACGDSMQDMGIYSGDLLVVDRSLTAEQGDTVIASIDGEYLRVT